MKNITPAWLFVYRQGTSDLTCQEFLQLQLQRDELQKLQQELHEIRRNSARCFLHVLVGLFGWQKNHPQTEGEWFLRYCFSDMSFCFERCPILGCATVKKWYGVELSGSTRPLHRNTEAKPLQTKEEVDKVEAGNSLSCVSFLSIFNISIIFLEELKQDQVLTVNIYTGWYSIFNITYICECHLFHFQSFTRSSLFWG